MKLAFPTMAAPMKKEKKLGTRMDLGPSIALSNMEYLGDKTLQFLRSNSRLNIDSN